jgi:hypothetical protein
MFKVFPLHIRGGNNRGIVGRGIIKDLKVVIKFSPVVNNTRLKVKIGFRGGGDVDSSSINIVTIRLDVANKAI